MPDHAVAPRERLKYLGLAVLTLFNTYVCASLVALALASLSDHQLVLGTVPLLCATVIVTALTVAILPRASWRRVGLGPGAGRGLPLGLVMGLLCCGVLVLVALPLGWARWAPIEAESLRFDLRATPVLGLALLAVGATAEELFARGLLLQCLARAFGPAGAVVLTSAGFAALHAANPGITALATCNTALFGAAFGVAVVRQRSLWLATGLHFGWNVAQAVLGVNISGITIRLSDLNLRLGRPEWVTGGDYGFEGGLLATGMALALLAVVWRLPTLAVSEPMLWDAPREDRGVVATGLGGIDHAAGAESGGPVSEREDGEVDAGTAGSVDSRPER
ncbi:MAG: type II CAAX endopeptidase family protein [Bryobacterales bacterium]|nr:type II CAAX endopeptidase family protein [Bryobacterales bacterium]